MAEDKKPEVKPEAKKEKPKEEKIFGFQKKNR